MPFANAATVRVEQDGTEVRLVEPLTYRGRDDRWIVPSGFVTDFASIPSVVAWLIPKLGLWTYAAILHDYFCVELARHRRDPCSYVRAHGEAGSTSPPISARDADGVFRRVMRESGVPRVLRWLVWTGVRWGALVNPARRPGWLRDAPLVLLISLLALPFVLPPVLLAVPARLLLRLLGGSS